MKSKYLLLFTILSIFFTLSSCGKNEVSNEVSQEYTTFKQSNSNNQSDSTNNFNENTYFLSTENDFNEKIMCNPIEQKYVIDREATTLEIWQAALAKCKVWNQQIDFTSLELKKLLSEADYEQLQNAVILWNEYYQEEVYQNRELYGISGMISGSMYTAISADVLMEKCKLMSFILLSQEYELSNNISFIENDNIVKTNDNNESSFSLQSFCIEYSSDFEELLNTYSLDEKNCDDLEAIIGETANKIEEKFGHDFAKHTNKYISITTLLYNIENDISEDSNLCVLLRKNRLKLCAAELLNIVYMLDEQ